MKLFQTTFFALAVPAILVCSIASASFLSAAQAYAPGEARISAAKQHPVGESALKEITRHGAVSETHADILAPLLGDWHYTAAFHAVPGIQPHKTMGRMTNEMILDNRVLSGTFIGELDVAGHNLSVKGQEIISYDAGGQKFTSVRIDTMITGMMISSGTYDEQQNLLVETGRFTDPRDGEERAFRSEIRFTDAESYTRTIFTLDKTGKQHPYMEFEYRRGP